MGHVAMYLKERNASKIESKDGGAANTMSFELKHNIADNISKYDYPLSIKVKTDWTKVEVTQGEAKLESKVDGGYVYFDAVPNAGTIIVKNANAAAPESSSSAEPPASSSSSEVVSSSSNGTIALPTQSLDGRHLAACGRKWLHHGSERPGFEHHGVQQPRQRCPYHQGYRHVAESLYRCQGHVCRKNRQQSLDNEHQVIQKFVV